MIIGIFWANYDKKVSVENALYRISSILYNYMDEDDIIYADENIISILKLMDLDDMVKPFSNNKKIEFDNIYILIGGNKNPSDFFKTSEIIKNIQSKEVSVVVV